MAHCLYKNNHKSCYTNRSLQYHSDGDLLARISQRTCTITLLDDPTNITLWLSLSGYHSPVLRSDLLHRSPNGPNMVANCKQCLVCNGLTSLLIQFIFRPSYWLSLSVRLCVRLLLFLCYYNRANNYSPALWFSLALLLPLVLELIRGPTICPVYCSPFVLKVHFISI